MAYIGGSLLTLPEIAEEAHQSLRGGRSRLSRPQGKSGRVTAIQATMIAARDIAAQSGGS